MSGSGNRAGAARRYRLALAGILLLGAWLRAIPIRSSLPYASYVDEGHVLEPVSILLRDRTWDPVWYGYPSLPFYLVAGAVVAASPLYQQVHGRSLWTDLPSENERDGRRGAYYDLIAPPFLFLIGRGLVLLFSVATIALVASLARRLTGERGALFAAFVTALCPALFLRGGIVIVDTVAAFWALAAIAIAERIQSRPAGDGGLVRLAAAAGILAGCAFSTKYQVGAVFLAVLIAVAVRPEPLRSRLRFAATAGAGLVGTALLTMPAWYLNPKGVLLSLRDQSGLYSVLRSERGYLAGALHIGEMGVPLVAVATAGIVTMLARRETRPLVLSWLAFGALMMAPLVGRPFQPFRNVVPLVPLACIAAAFFLDGVAVRLKRPGPILAAIALLAWGGSLLRLAVPFQTAIRNRVDTRVEAVNWLAVNTKPGDVVLVERELAILPAELRRIPARVEVAPWEEVLPRGERATWIVFGKIGREGAADGELIPGLEHWNQVVTESPAAARFGWRATPINPHFWRTNDQLVVIRRGPGAG